MKKRRDTASRSSGTTGNVARSDGRTLTSYAVGALPILNRVIARSKIEHYLKEFVFEDKRCRLSPVTGALILLRNYLVSREPIYGVGEWARQCAPGLLGVVLGNTKKLNDDAVGRCLDRLFRADCSALVLAVTRHVVKEFDLDLSEIHNDSTTVTFCGSYDGAKEPTDFAGKTVPAITWGHNKDHRPDLKQLLYNLTVSADGGVPVAFGVENGNMTDDQTHQDNWDFLCQIVGSPDFIYVADSKLATHANMTHIANRGGRFLSVLPATRREDRVLRERMLEETLEWDPVLEKRDEAGSITDAVSTIRDPACTTEGFRLIWYHSTRKVDLDRKARSSVIQRGLGALSKLRAKLRSPRTRYRDEEKVTRAVARCLAQCRAMPWITVAVLPQQREVFIQECRGRPGPDTRYRKELCTRYDIVFDIDRDEVDAAERLDGIFPLVTNDRDLSVKDVYLTYKRQAQIEKRFSQLKTQFQVAPVFLKLPHRVVALLTVYYLALLVQALLEREVRRAMKDTGIYALPLYPEERECRAPTTRRIIDFFENVQLHELRTAEGGPPLRFTTELTTTQQKLLELLGVPSSEYEA